MYSASQHQASGNPLGERDSIATITANMLVAILAPGSSDGVLPLANELCVRVPEVADELMDAVQQVLGATNSPAHRCTALATVAEVARQALREAATEDTPTDTPTAATPGHQRVDDCGSTDASANVSTVSVTVVHDGGGGGDGPRSGSSGLQRSASRNYPRELNLLAVSRISSISVVGSLCSWDGIEGVTSSTPAPTVGEPCSNNTVTSSATASLSCGEAQSSSSTASATSTATKENVCDVCADTETKAARANATMDLSHLNAHSSTDCADEDSSCIDDGALVTETTGQFNESLIVKSGSPFQLIKHTITVFRSLVASIAEEKESSLDRVQAIEETLASAVSKTLLRLKVSTFVVTPC